MPIKLLNQSEVAQAQAKDKAREASEGLKLAKRIDNLRELYSKEEQSLELWRTSTVTKITNDILELQRKKEDLIEEVNQLKQEKENLST